MADDEAPEAFIANTVNVDTTTAIVTPDCRTFPNMGSHLEMNDDAQAMAPMRAYTRSKLADANAQFRLRETVATR
jgi:hypothetical protein